VLPATGDAYWHDLRAAWVVEVTDGDPPEVQIELDEQRDEAFYAQLPADAIIDARRDGDTGRWHADVYESQASRANHRAVGWGIGDDCDTAVSMAISAALKVLRQRAE
jgi:pheromone shutdown protein TraB